MNDSLPPLPEYEPRPDLWERIEANLRGHNLKSDEELSWIGAELPTYEPKKEVWDAVQKELDSVPVRPIWKASYHRWIGAGLTAAAVIVVVGVWLFLHPNATEQVYIEYTIESTPKSLPGQLMSNRRSVTKQAEAFIAQQCAQQRLACQRPEVHELRNQLVELNTQQQRIKQEIQVFGDDPALISAQVKLDNQRDEVLKELITILRS